MPNGLDFLSGRHKSNDDYFEFYALAGELDAFDLEEATIVGCGREKHRGDEVLYRVQEDRWVLAYAPYQDEENDDEPLPPNRELSPTDASRWFRLNETRLAGGLYPARP